MCRFEADVSRVADGPGAVALEQFRADGMIERDGEVIRVTQRGRPFVRTIAAAFDRYLDPVAGRHVGAV